MGTYSRVSKTTSFDFDEDKFKRLDEKRTRTHKNLIFKSWMREKYFISEGTVSFKFQRR